MSASDTPLLADPDPALLSAQQALTLQMELTAVLARGRGVDRLLRRWHERTGEQVAVFDRLGTPLGRSEGFPAGLLGDVTEALGERAPKLGQTLPLALDDAGDTRAIEVTPFAGNDTVRGFLARVRLEVAPLAATPSAAATAALAAPALRSLLALEYERHWLMDEPARRQRERQLARVLAMGADEDATALLRGLGIDAPSLRGLQIEARDETHAEVLVDDLAAMFSLPLVRHRGRIVECLIPIDPLPALADYGLRTPMGLGTPLPPQSALRSMRQAELALETSRRVGAPIEYRDGAAHDFLLQIASPEYLQRSRRPRSA